MVVTLRGTAELAPGGELLALASVAKSAGDATEGIKSTNRLRNVLALEEARARGAWEALFATTGGELSEGTMSNLFVVAGSGLEPGHDSKAGVEIATPELAHGCLAGTTRALVVESLRELGYTVRERRVTLDDLVGASEAFLTNTSQRVVPLRGVLGADGEPLATALDPHGPVARAAREAVAAAEARYRASKRG